MKALTSITLLLIIFGNSVAQSIRVVHDRQGYMSGIADMNAYERKDWTCKLESARVTLTKINYLDDTDTMIGLTVQLANSRRFSVVIGDELEGLSNEADKSSLESFLAKGRRYKISYFRCGAGGHSDLMLASIYSVK